MLDDIFSRKVKDILFYLISNSSKEVSQKEIMKSTGVSKATMAKVIPKLKGKCLVSVKRIGVTNLVSLDNGNVLVKEIKKLKVLSELDDIKRVKGCEIYVYGSCARGDYVEESDLDILLIGQVKREDVIEDMEKLSKKIRRVVSFKVFTDMEWAKLAKKDPAFYERVEKDKIRLV